MNPELQRVKIAEAVNPMGLSVCTGCWNFVDPETCGCGEPAKGGYHDNHSPIPMGCRCHYANQPQPSNVPNYLSDLNSCAEMERVLNEDQAVLYRHRLAMNSDGGNAPFLTVEAALCHATAPQRCEAFLRVMGLWQDS